MSESLRNDGRIWVPRGHDESRMAKDIPDEERYYYLEDTSGTHRQPSQSPAREEAERIRAAEQSQLAMTLAASQAERTRARAEQRTEQVRRLEERRAQHKAERDRRRARRR